MNETRDQFVLRMTEVFCANAGETWINVENHDMQRILFELGVLLSIERSIVRRKMMETGS